MPEREVEETRGYRDLIAWQRGMLLVTEVYGLVKKLPQHELYCLSSQIRRAAIFVPANIAEGQGRHHPREFHNFLSIARGSLAELDTLLLAGQNLGYWSDFELTDSLEMISELRRILQGLMKSISIN